MRGERGAASTPLRDSAAAAPRAASAHSRSALSAHTASDWQPHRRCSLLHATTRGASRAGRASGRGTRVKKATCRRPLRFSARAGAACGARSPRTTAVAARPHAQTLGAHPRWVGRAVEARVAAGATPKQRRGPIGPGGGRRFSGSDRQRQGPHARAVHTERQTIVLSTPPPGHVRVVIVAGWRKGRKGVPSEKTTTQCHHTRRFRLLGESAPRAVGFSSWPHGHVHVPHGHAHRRPRPATRGEGAQRPHSQLPMRARPCPTLNSPFPQPDPPPPPPSCRAAATAANHAAAGGEDDGAGPSTARRPAVLLRPVAFDVVAARVVVGGEVRMG